MIVRPRPGNHRQGTIAFGPLTFPCALGSGATSALKREGDGATPIARMRLLGGYFRPGGVVGSAPAAPLRLAPTTPSLGWCDTPGDRNYNRPVPLPYPAGYETMMRADRLYDVCLVLDWNIRPRRRGMGSAIFLHIARPGLKPTEGCIAVTPAVMRRLLPHLRRGGVVRVMG